MCGSFSNFLTFSNLAIIVIGRGGEQISQIQTQTSCRVQMSPESDANNMRQCTLQGTKMAVDRARAMIQEVVSARLKNQEVRALE